MHNLSAVSVALSVRPLRSVVFVPEVEGVAWQRLFRMALRCHTATWGGWGNLALPLPSEDCAEDELFWALLDAFDADTFHAMPVTVGDLEWLSPQRYSERRAERERELVDWPEGVAAHAAEELRRELVTPAVLPGSAHELLRARVAPLAITPEVSTGDPYTSDLPPWPLTAAERLRPLPSQLHTGPCFPDDDLALIDAAAHGELSPRLHEVLTKADVNITPVERAGDADWLSAIHPRSGAPMRELAGLGADLYAARGGPEPGLVLCVGDDRWDFAFAHALNRLGVDAQWVPSRAAADSAALHALAAFARRFHRSSKLQVRLCSVSADDAAEALAAGLADPLVNLATERCRAHELIPMAPARIYERDRDLHYRPMLVHGAEMTPHLQTPVPKRLRAASPDDMHWMTDIEVEGWKSIRHHLLGRSLLSSLPITEGVVRCGRDAISYLCPNVMLRTHLSLESQTPRPQLAAAHLADQVEAVLTADGWHAEPSDKGIYLRQSASIFGGMDQLVEALSDARGKLLTLFIASGAVAPGRSLDGRRYVRLQDLVAAHPSGQDAESVILGLEDSGALIRGFVLKCQHCRNSRFYRLADIGEDFQCARCSTRQPVNQQSLLVTPRDPEPRWRYGLAEVIYQFLKANGDLPLLSAYRFASERAKGRGLFRLVGELDIFPPTGKARELDIILADGSELWLGEATVQNSLGDEAERFARLAQLAQLLCARGVLLITSNRWAEATKARARETFPGIWPRLELIESSPRATQWTPPGE
jgi:hypothetical protein